MSWTRLAGTRSSLRVEVLGRLPETIGFEPNALSEILEDVPFLEGIGVAESFAAAVVVVYENGTISWYADRD
jgi:hypothetical protein